MNGMMTKLFEIRDSCTFIPVMATALVARSGHEAYLLRRAGYQDDSFNPSFLVTRLNDCLSASDANEWSNRTMRVAHRYIEEHFESLECGEVIDVEFILRESSRPKVSERLEVLG